MGMGGRGGGGGAMTWQVYEAPEELTMTYDEFIAKTGEARAAIPAPFLRKTDGAPEKFTRNEWSQFQRLYGGAGKAVDEAAPGRIGKGLVKAGEDADAYHYHALKAMAQAYLHGLNNFTFEVGYPQIDFGTFGIIGGSGGNVTVRVPVVMRVKQGAASSYPEYVYRTLRKFDCLGMAIPQGNGVGNTSEPFYVHTQKGGMWQPHAVNLPAQSGALWSAAWASHAVGLALYDPNGQIIDLSLQPAGQSGGILAKMLNPDVIYFSPRYKLLLWPEGRTQSGARWNVSGTRGWAYEFSFSMTRDQARRIHRAKAKLVPTLALGVGMDAGALRDRWDKLSTELSNIKIDDVIQRGGGGSAAGPGGPGGGGPGMPAGGGGGMGPGMGGGMGPGMGGGMGPGMAGGAPGGPGMPGGGGPGMP
jgi:hypothetical protein